MGPVAEIVERSGGSVERLFRRAELPLRLISEPDRLILLKDQLNLVECAAREIGDETLAARLSTKAGFAGLGSYAREVNATSHLGRALVRAGETIGPMLQSSTTLTLVRSGRFAKWTYRVTDPVEIGRQRNEMLAIGYMPDLVRRFAGASWVPTRVELPGPPIAAKSAVEAILRCEIVHGEAAAIAFPTELLDLANPRSQDREPTDAAELPESDDVVACVEHLIGLGLLERRPVIDWICRRMEVSRRSLQRRLGSRRTSFNAILRRVLVARASELLGSGASATEVAFEVGYSDPAHFTRALRRWTGRTPREWQRQAPPRTR